jgi:GNAT superfamily N-acetyltransferase
MKISELAGFHHGIYREAFPEQYEPLEAWERALAGEAPYELTIDFAREGAAIIGGICYELYPQSRCGFLTYLVVAPAARGRGVGKQLLDGALRSLRARGAIAIFAEVNDPERDGKTTETREEKAARLAMFMRWGAKLVDFPYVQPSLGPGLSRDHGLRLLAFDAENEIPGEVIAGFVRELYTACEGGVEMPSLP